MFARLRHQIKKTAQRFALGGIGAVLALSGIGFLSASALLLLLTLTDPITACAIMGGAFLGTGLLFMLAARPSHKHDTPKHTQESQEAMPPVAAAFMQGMAQGLAAGRVRH
ncbi:phage holin family protein [uncultured Roseobacter sp.]|uniref:phage holin family protein n=1 Tax=uncultured Roseobacter sp. TaxID=114847 RepID=UPI002618B4BA|nr:phage holin family protein [uncultured Roseobacter sp.]